MNGVGDEPKPSIAPQVSQPAPIQVNSFTKCLSLTEVFLLFIINFYGNYIEKTNYCINNYYFLYYMQPAIAKSVSETTQKCIHWMSKMTVDFARFTSFQSQTNLPASYF